MKVKILCLAVLLSGCAAQPARLSDTHWPEVEVAASKEAVKEKLLVAAASVGGSIESESSSTLKVRSPDSNAAMAKAFFGCGSCPDPYLEMQFIFSETAGKTRVIAQYWRVVPKANGALERHDMTNATDYNDVQIALWKLRDSF